MSLGGSVGIEHVLSQSEIDEAGGRVGDAIEQFNNEVVDFLASYGWDALPETTTRRPKDNVFNFEVSATKFYGHAETDVCGPLVELKKGTSATEAADLGIDTAGWPDANDGENELRDILETDSPYKVVHLSVSCVDYDEDVCDVYDELIF